VLEGQQVTITVTHNMGHQFVIMNVHVYTYDMSVLSDTYPLSK